MPDGAHVHGSARPLVSGGLLLALAAIAAAIVAALFVGRLLLDVFSVEGLAYTVGFGAGDTLLWRAGTRVAAILLVVELAAVVSAALDWLEADLDVLTLRQAWFTGHLTLARRAVRRVSWWARSIRVLVLHMRRKPAPALPVQTATNLDDMAPTLTLTELEPHDAVVLFPSDRRRDAA